jgi:uncharacterized protein with NAD-binding domain and iron-sulfur cluster
MTTTVAVLGGGVAGLSAAHELAERGFEVTVLEGRDVAGGKARSFPWPGSGCGGRADLPGEHGFRFFPGFYRHVIDTMRRIPAGAGSGSVLDRLVPATRVLLAQAGGRNELVGPAQAPTSLEDFAMITRFLVAWSTSLGIPAVDQAAFVERLLILLTSCDERRFGQWEHQSWWRFSGAEGRSEAYGKFLADGITRTLVAARGREMSARSGGTILLQFLFDLTQAGGRIDRLLDGPTSEVWIDPWVAHLTASGVRLRLGCPVTGIAVRQGRIADVTVAPGGVAETVTADHYVAALPVEQLRLLVSPELRAADPQLARLDRLVTRWMNGVVFYLDKDVRLVHGHAIYVDSPWALTSVSQRQFWPRFDPAAHGDGRVEGLFSVDVSEWERPAPRLGKVASKCTREEIVEEVWAQLKDHLDDDAARARGREPAWRLPGPLDPVPQPQRDDEPGAAAH